MSRNGNCSHRRCKLASPGRNLRVRPENRVRWYAALPRLRARVGAAILLALLSMPLRIVDASSLKDIDPEGSVLVVRVYKAGLFSALGHEHEIRASIQNGVFDEETSTVDFVVDARALRVLDPNISDKDREEIETTMLGPKVLDAAKFPEIRFHSTEVTRSSENGWTVHGDLTLREQTHPVNVDVKRREGRYRGAVRLRQSEFGITPVTIAGGAIRVKDEVRVEFDVVGR